MTQPVFGFIPAAPFVAPALPVAVPAVTGAAVAGVGLAASLPVAVAVGIGLAGGFLLGAALAQLWGRAAGPIRSIPVLLADKTTTQLVFTSSKTIQYTISWTMVESVTSCSTGLVTFSNTYTVVRTAQTRTAYGVRIQNGTMSFVGSCGAPSNLIDFVDKLQVFDGINWGSPVESWGGGFWTSSDRVHKKTLLSWFSALKVNGVDYVPPAIQNDWAGASSVNDFEELPEVSSLFAEGLPPAPLPLPDAFVPGPIGDSLTEQDNSTAPLPMLPPLVSPWPWPAAAPSARPVLNDGTLAPLAPALPASVPADVHYPVPGGAPVGGLAQAPQATLAGIAAEVGRIESKLNRMLNPTPVGDSSDLMQLLWQAIQALYNSMTDNRPAGAYLLSSPCELDANGDRILSSVTWPATEDNTAAVLARIDAIAALLQTHKDLKQPNCKPPAATGQPVQVQFTQI